MVKLSNIIVHRPIKIYFLSLWTSCYYIVTNNVGTGHTHACTDMHILAYAYILILKNKVILRNQACTIQIPDLKQVQHILTIAFLHYIYIKQYKRPL